nr:MAG TPA: hypothetical protein [Bacteriophage sp.]
MKCPATATLVAEKASQRGFRKIEPKVLLKAGAKPENT